MVVVSMFNTVHRRTTSNPVIRYTKDMAREWLRNRTRPLFTVSESEWEAIEEKAIELIFSDSVYRPLQSLQVRPPMGE